MSANNQILISHNGKCWDIVDRDIEGNFEGIYIDNAKELEWAIFIANEYQRRNIVEYGISIITRYDKQKSSMQKAYSNKSNRKG